MVRFIKDPVHAFDGTVDEVQPWIHVQSRLHASVGEWSKAKA